ncbi:Maf-like protein [Sphingorhabdus soli]|uniref:Nucleoside triphosphate pyrophosphatase n=1 Tax=Flavisphingopyxis soli TaxID=2601267 RepID=A0A5C6UK56_9SPHN|nr:Maf family protein [Sphingorhabdus soli]TXC73412.1 Maf-like protein [Sphingorhabdus soli]
MSERIVLASGSASRRAMLTHAGVPHDVMPTQVDEAAIKRDLATSAPADLAAALALAKARAGSDAAPGRIVLGGDSLVALDGRIYDKPASRAEAAEHLAAFSDHTIALHSAAALVRDGQTLATTADVAQLVVRPLSPGFIEAYLDAEWPAIAACAGCFRIEGMGVQLFSSLKGNHFTILGMPLLGLLSELRTLDVMTS